MAGFVLPVISGLAGLFGGGSTQKTQSQTSGNQQGQTFGSSTPTLNPFQQSLAALFSRGAMDQYNQGTNLAPYTSAGLQSIQGQGNQNSRAIANNLATRGLSFSPAAGSATTQNLLNTGNQMQGFLQQIPLLQHQLQSQNLDQLMRAFGSMPFGQDTSGTSNTNTSGTTNSVQSTPGGGLAGLLGGLGAGLAGPNQGGTGNQLQSILDMFKPKVPAQGTPGNWYMGG